MLYFLLYSVNHFVVYLFSVFQLLIYQFALRFTFCFLSLSLPTVLFPLFVPRLPFFVWTQILCPYQTACSVPESCALRRLEIELELRWEAGGTKDFGAESRRAGHQTHRLPCVSSPLVCVVVVSTSCQVGFSAVIFIPSVVHFLVAGNPVPACLSARRVGRAVGAENCRRLLQQLGIFLLENPQTLPRCRRCHRRDIRS